MMFFLMMSPFSGSLSLFLFLFLFWCWCEFFWKCYWYFFNWNSFDC
jgi:hypothetical protein